MVMAFCWYNCLQCGGGCHSQCLNPNDCHHPKRVDGKRVRGYYWDDD